MQHHRLITGPFLIVGALWFAGNVAILPEPARAEENAFTLAKLRKVRKEMTHRKRRIIFNNDGDDFEGHGGKGNNRTEASAAITTTPEVGFPPLTDPGL